MLYNQWSDQTDLLPDVHSTVCVRKLRHDSTEWVPVPRIGRLMRACRVAPSCMSTASLCRSVQCLCKALFEDNGSYNVRKLQSLCLQCCVFVKLGQTNVLQYQFELTDIKHFRCTEICRSDRSSDRCAAPTFWAMARSQATATCRACRLHCTTWVLTLVCRCIWTFNPGAERLAASRSDSCQQGCTAS